MIARLIAFFAHRPWSVLGLTLLCAVLVFLVLQFGRYVTLLHHNVSDVIGKAQRGLGISDSQLAERAGVTSDKVRSLRSGEFDDDAIGRIAPDCHELCWRRPT